MVSYPLFDRLTNTGRHCLRLRVVRAENSQMQQLGRVSDSFFLVEIPVKLTIASARNGFTRMKPSVAAHEAGTYAQ
jgi:hypothetical protein